MHAVDILKYGHYTVLRPLEGLAEPDWRTAGACGIWAVKDIMAHLTSYELVLVEILSGLLDGSPTPTIERFTQDPQRFNDVEVGSRQGQIVEDVMAEYRAAYGQTARLIARVPPEMFQQTGILPWYGAEYDLDDFLVYTFYGHKREHAAQIAAFRDLLTRKNGRA